jgi:hypothetical protein
MYDFDKLRWADMQHMKVTAYENGEMNFANFWQNEQLMKKLTDILFALKGTTNV